MRKTFYIASLLTVCLSSCNISKTNDNSVNNDSILIATDADDSNLIFGTPHKTSLSLFHQGMRKSDVDEAINQLREEGGPWIKINDLEFVIDWENTSFANGKLSVLCFEAVAPEEFYKDKNTDNWKRIYSEDGKYSYEEMLEQNSFIAHCIAKTYGTEYEDHGYDERFIQQTFGKLQITNTIGIGYELIEKGRENKAAGIMDAENSYVDVYNSVYKIEIIDLQNFSDVE